ncbi:C4-dicarboxylate TRAP transporter substrate-binding protein [Frigidibacter sp.]|uniref:C4-dicarboxylate TRAP transporter substrate-binding protein n=1 Tax=Frigidibacter sp. TaxID=2586418 RepID=UPI0027364854|nr:C4-dicarboxylate TRAP transporter substrate-binding protein [Frigidibacter sp.]MDP3342215.1 C4-dicarboxylate TRAP transporter substrate-binding protein [Frigidibacter sp.]
MNILTKAAAGGVLGLAVLAAPASAETIRLTVVSGYAPTAGWVKQFEEVFVPQVDKRLAETGNHEIRWNLAWGTIAKPAGEFEAIETGLGDIGIIQTVFHPDKVPMYNIAYVTPFVSADIAQITAVVNGLAKVEPSMTEVWAKYDQHMLTTLAGVDNYQLLLKDPITSPADLQGRKLCGAGLNLRYVEGQGVVGVPSPLSDWYNNIRSGICDGTVVWPEAIVNFKLYEVAPYLVDVSFGGVNSMALTVNADRWEALPEEVQTVLTEVADEYRLALANYAMDRSVQSVETFKANGGTVIEMDTPARQAWAQGIPPIATEWADSLEAQGVPGKAILANYLSGMTAAGATPLRDWTE